MVSVVCGHSLCKHCATQPIASAAVSDTDSTTSDDPAVDDNVARCPVCDKHLEGFVTNFEALATLQATPKLQPASSPNLSTAPAHSNEPDLTTVVTEDLVINRSLIHFTRAASHELGRGASAVVYKGLYNRLPVAIKCIRTMSDSFASEDRLRRELRNASRLKNPHIVEFRGAAWDFEDGPQSPRNVLLVTELMAGGNLRENLNTLPDECGLAVDSFVHLALQIARGIEYLHAEGLAHRDIKSANILLTEALPKSSNRFPAVTRAKIADFGLSKYIDRATGGGTVMQSIMEPGRLEATYAYLAPEAFGGDKSNIIKRKDSDDDDVRYDNMAKKRDIYALGVLFWEMLTGAVPWAGVSLPDVYVRVCVRSDRPTPALDDKTVDRTFHRLIDRCWAQNPSRRPSARSIVAKLEKLAVKYPLADATAAAAVESVSIVSGPAPTTNQPDIATSTPAVDIQKPLPYSRDLQYPSESLLAYQKMPSASSVHTTPYDDIKASSTGQDASEGTLVIIDDVPSNYEDLMWTKDDDANGKGGPVRSSSMHAGAVSVAVGNTSLGNAHQNHSLHLPHNNTSAEAGHQQYRKLTRSRHNDSEPNEGSVSKHPTHGPPNHSNLPSSAHSGATGSHGPSLNTSVGKTSATAVAATAAAIAAAKDRERKRDDLRHARVVAATTPAARAIRGATLNGANGTSGAITGITDSSYQSLTGATDAVVRPNLKEKSDRALVVYPNSDEEAEEFDPDRAAADEAIAESSNKTAHQSGNQIVGRLSTSGSRPIVQQSQHHSLLSRVTGRPKSPVVRRPMSPTKAKPFSSSTAQGRVSGDDDVKAGQSLNRSADVTNGAPSGPKRSVSATRGRLGRTLSASTSGPNAARATAATAGNGVGTTAPSAGHAPGMVGSATMPVPTSSPMYANGTANGSGNASGNGGLVTSSSSTTDGTGRRAFIRRMRSNESGKRIVKSPSSTGVEHRRGKDYHVVGSGSASGLGGVHRMGPGVNSASIHITGTRLSDENERDGDVVGIRGAGIGQKTTSLITTPVIGASNGSSLNGASKENFIALVDSMDKKELLRSLTQRMQSLRLAAMAHAALLSVRHRNDEEVLRNCCAYLHRLTVPHGSSSSQSTVSGRQRFGQTDEQGHQSSSGGHDVTAKEQVSIRKYLKSRQGVEALLQALHPAEVRHPTTLCYGLLALGNLTAWDLEAHKQFRTSHGVIQVVQVMKVHSSNIGVQEKGCYALACVGTSYSPKSKPIFEESGGLDVVIRALSNVQDNDSNDAVTKQACAALGAMCSMCPSNALYAGRKDALGYLVKSFDRFRKASKGESGGKRSEMRLVCKAFVDLLCDTENRKVAGAEGGSTMILRAMRIFRLDAEFVEKGLVTLAQFCVLRSNGMQIVQANGVDDIVAAMDRFKMSEVMQKEGCRVLTVLLRVTGDQGRRKVVQAKGAEAIVYALERFGGIAEANEEVVLEACRALCELFAMDNVAEGETLGRQMRKMRCDKTIRNAMAMHRTDMDIQQVARDALKHLSSLRGSGGLWSRMRNGSKKW